MKENLFNPYNRYNGIYIPDGVYNHPILTPTSKLVYGRLLRYAGKEGYAYPKQKTMALQLGISIATIKNAISQLIEEKFILVEKGNPIKHQPNTYYFIEHECLGMMEKNVSIRRAKNYTSTGLKTSPPNKESHLEESISKRKNIKKEKQKDNLFLHLFPEYLSNKKEFIEAWKLFVEMRVQVIKKWSEQSCKGIITKLIDSQVNAKGARELLMESVSNEWKSVFPKNLDQEDRRLFLDFEERKALKKYKRRTIKK